MDVLDEPTRRAGQQRRRLLTTVVVLTLALALVGSACSAAKGRVDEGPQHTVNVGTVGLTPGFWIYVHARPTGQLVWLHRLNEGEIYATRDFVVGLNIINKEKSLGCVFGQCVWRGVLGKTQWNELWTNAHNSNLTRIRDLLGTLAFMQGLRQNAGYPADYSGVCLEIESRGVGGSTKWSPLSKVTGSRGGNWWTPASTSGCNWGQKVTF